MKGAKANPVLTVLLKAGAFMKRDFRIATSYQLQFILTTFNSIFILAMLYFIGRMVNPDTPGLARFGGNYFAFVLIGYGFYQYFQLALTSFSGTIQSEQMSGCLEAVLGTQTRPEEAIIFSSFYGMLVAFAQLILIFIFGSLAFKADLSRINAAATLAAFALSVMVFTGFGIVSAAFIVVNKKGDPLGWLIMTLNFVFGGAFFPLEQMPSWMRDVAAFIPATYALDSLRMSIMNGSSIVDLARPLGMLALMAVLILPLSFVLFRRAIRRAKKEGTMVLY
jgi:ABC-2 type transport system permease protein